MAKDGGSGSCEPDDAGEIPGRRSDDPHKAHKDHDRVQRPEEGTGDRKIHRGECSHKQCTR